MIKLYSFLLSLSDLSLYLILSVTFIIVSALLTLIVRRIIPSHIRARDNAVIIGTSNLVSLIYGVLVGLSALYLINNISFTADAVQKEANATADVYRDSKWLDEPVKTDIKNKLVIYLNSVINEEWPLMQNGKRISNKNDFLIDSMTDEIEGHQASTDMKIHLQKDTLTSLENLYNARQQRIHMSYSMLNPDLWVVIIIGTILTLVINYIYDMNFYLHLVTITTVALMTSAMVFLLVALDGPFQGDFVIGPRSMEDVLHYIEQKVG